MASLMVSWEVCEIILTRENELRIHYQQRLSISMVFRTQYSQFFLVESSFKLDFVTILNRILEVWTLSLTLDLAFRLELWTLDLDCGLGL